MNSITLSGYVLQQSTLVESELAMVIGDIAESCKRVAEAVNQGALRGDMGELATENIQGEIQKQLDTIANDIFITQNVRSGFVAGMASEEMDQPYQIPEPLRRFGQYLLLFDPLDGSSNVNVNITVGSIFSIIRCPPGVVEPELTDFLQAGTYQICAGYALYGSSTMLVLTVGQGVQGFTLDQRSKQFVLTHPDMKVPEQSQEFAINISNQRHWELPITRYIDECLAGLAGPRHKDFNMRWVGSMVAEVHRILIRGGVFLYPIDSKIKGKGGRLRLLYEANPMSFIIEQAGGCASTGHQRILDVKPEELHQRIPVILGSKTEVEMVVGYHQI